jgi:hypothetical protein
MEKSWIEQQNPEINPNFISFCNEEIEKGLSCLKDIEYLRIAEKVVSEVIEHWERKPYKRGTITLRGSIFYNDVFYYITSSFSPNNEKQKIIRLGIDSYVIARLRLEGFDVHS